MTGKEVVQVDDRVVSEQRVIAKRSEHRVTVGDDDYQIRFVVTGSFFCEVTCELIKNGELIASQHMRSIESKADMIKMVLILFGLGLISGFFAAKFVLMLVG